MAPLFPNADGSFGCSIRSKRDLRLTIMDILRSLRCWSSELGQSENELRLAPSDSFLALPPSLDTINSIFFSSPLSLIVYSRINSPFGLHLAMPVASE